LEKVREFAGLSDEEVNMLKAGLGLEQAGKMVENVVATFHLPLGIAVNFRINGKDYMIPMATEETSVVAAASNAAKMCRPLGGFRASSTDPVMTGQIQVLAKTQRRQRKPSNQKRRR